MKIESMTEDQERKMYEYREAQRLRGISCGRADRQKAVKAINFFYEKLGRKSPMVWICDSPYMAQIWINIFKGKIGSNLWGNLWANLGANLWANLWANLGENLGANLRANLRDNLWSNLWGNLRDNLWANLGDNLGANLRANLRDNLWDNLGYNLGDNIWANLGDNLGANLRDNLWANLGDNLRDNLGDNLRANLGDNLWANLGDNLGANLRDNLGDNLRANLIKNLEFTPTYLYGQMDLSWISFYTFPHINLKKIHTDEQFEGLQAWEDMAGSGFWYPFENIVFVSDRFKTLHQDSENRLHHESEMAMSFWDGYGFYSWHGVRVSEKVIKKQFTASDINLEENAEVRRAMIEIMGAEEYLKQSNAIKIDSSEMGTLYSSPVKDDEPIVMVELDNSTPEPDGSIKKYWLRVPPTIKRAREAVAWTFGMSEKEYAPEVET